MSKQLTETEKVVLSQIRASRRAEREGRAAAREAGRKLTEKLLADQRAETDRLALMARDHYGMPMTLIIAEGFETTDRTGVYKRLRDAQPSLGNTVKLEGEKLPYSGKIEFLKASDKLTVRLDRFTHADIGSDLTGEISFDLDGEELESTLASTEGDESGNPMIGIALWGFQPVQDALK